MVTDQNYRFTSPAGRECILAAARFAAVNPSSRVLDLGCGLGAAACTLAREFRCRVDALDNRPGFTKIARNSAVEQNVSHLVKIEEVDPLKSDFSEDPYDLAVLEGGFLNAASESALMHKIPDWLLSRGWLAFANLIYTVSDIPPEIRLTFGEPNKVVPNEGKIREMIDSVGLELHYVGMVAPSSWDNYYSFVARKLGDKDGYYSDYLVKTRLHKEIDIFYNQNALQCLGYLFCIARKKN